MNTIHLKKFLAVALPLLVVSAVPTIVGGIASVIGVTYALVYNLNDNTDEGSKSDTPRK